jgi:nicotinamidase-related amidase
VAHLVIDMQTGFMAPGAPAEMAPAASVIPNINRISAACRKAAALNIFVQNSISEESKESWSNWFEAFWTPDKREGMYATFMVRKPGHALHPDVEVESGTCASTSSGLVFSSRGHPACTDACARVASIPSSSPGPRPTSAASRLLELVRFVERIACSWETVSR